MYYKIDQIIIFNSLTGELSHYDGRAEVQRLPDPACRLLAFLIINKNRVISREELLDEIWEQHSLKSSYSNLGNYLRGTRTAFINLGFAKDVISTVPKKGLQFNVEIDVEEIVLLERTPSEKILESETTKKKSHFFLFFLFFLFFFSGLAVYWFFLNNTPVRSQNEPTFLKKLIAIKSCSLYALNHSYDEDFLQIVIQKNIEALNIDCDKKKSILYYTDSPYSLFDVAIKSHTLFIVCATGAAIGTGKCVSYYTSWKPE